MINLDVLNPMAQIAKPQDAKLADRLDTLDGKTIALYWDNKPGGDVVNNFTAEILTEKYQGLEFKNYYGSIGIEVRHSTPAELDKIAQEVDAVIGAIGD